MTNESDKPLYDGLCTSADWQKLSTPIAVLGIASGTSPANWGPRACR